jgi:branched-chain amino acid transport system permease protein
MPPIAQLREPWLRATWGALALVVLVLPFALDAYPVFQLTLAMAQAIAVLGLSILIGYSGQFSLGHGAFFALGAYATAIMVDRWQIPYAMAIPAAGAAGLVAGLAFGLPALRIRGLQLVLATMALALALPQVLKHPGLQGWTNGAQGIVLAKPEPPAWVPLTSDQWLYYITCGMLLVSLVLARNLLGGYMGRAFTALRQHDLVAQAVGIPTSTLRVAAFGLSTMYAVVGGGLSAVLIQYVSADSFNLFLEPPDQPLRVHDLTGAHARPSSVWFRSLSRKHHSQRRQYQRPRTPDSVARRPGEHVCE